MARKHRGCTATELVNGLRMELAAARLRLSDDSVAAVAGYVGIRDVGHFYHLFTATYGQTPRRFRQRDLPGPPPSAPRS